MEFIPQLGEIKLSVYHLLKAGQQGYLASRAYTIYGGASEVQRDVIAKNVLGLTKKSTK